MNQPTNRATDSITTKSNSYTVRYALLGSAFGLLFPIIATLIALNQSGLSISLANIFELHSSSPLLLIIDTAPLFLGIFAGIAGRREDRLQESNRRLEDLVNSLEVRVTDRTRDLDRAVEVGHGVTQVTDLDQMLAQAVELIRSSFELYYVQVYLLDTTKSSLVLRAGTGLAGTTLLNQRHRLPLGLGNIVGTAAIEKQTIVVANTAASQLYQLNPLLPNTWSEMAMPLVVADNVIGVLDLQSDNPGQLSEESLPALEAVAGQLAIAIEHARLVAEATEARSDIEEQVRRMAHLGWEDFFNAVDRSEFIGYSFESNSIRSISESVTGDLSDNSFAVPIVITGERVGNIQIQGSPERPFSRYETELAAAIADQVGRQVENLRLLAEADHYRVEAEEATRRLTREGWQRFLETLGNQGTGFEYDSVNVRRLGELNGNDPLGELTYAKALKVRGEIIGALEVDAGAEYDEDTVELVTAVAEQLSTHLETLRLAESIERALADTEEQAQRLAALNNLSQALSSASSLDEVYRVIATHSRIIVPSDRISLARLGEDGNYFEILALHSEKEATKVGDVFSGEGNVLSSAIQHNRVFTINRGGEGGLPGIESFMVAPLKAGGRIFGTLNAGSNQPDAFDRRDETLLLQIASLLASTLETRRLFTETVRRAEELAVISRMARSRAEELAVLNEMGKALTSLADEASVIRIVQQHTAHLMEAGGFYIALYDPEGDEVSITVFGEDGDGRPSTIVRRSGNGITEHILRTRQPLLIRDNVAKEVSQLGIEAFGQMAKAWLGVPMIVGDNIIGVLAVQSFEEEGVYDEHHLDLLEGVANQAAIALENARLFRQVEDRARRERILREITARVRGSADVDSVMRTAAQELGRALGRQTYVYLGENLTEEEGDNGKEA